jgi:hypothetical protein
MLAACLLFYARRHGGGAVGGLHTARSRKILFFRCRAVLSDSALVPSDLAIMPSDAK